ncbi:hypothetical protein [Amycolatopsis sp. NBC_00438]|uniref:hypothetical protein n=1 Tax=Amycolatopsis sp. NBC_00438 TaxID=2903558 RepID=UPI002E1E6392
MPAGLPTRLPIHLRRPDTSWPSPSPLDQHHQAACFDIDDDARGTAVKLVKLDDPAPALLDLCNRTFTDDE